MAGIQLTCPWIAKVTAAKYTLEMFHPKAKSKAENRHRSSVKVRLDFNEHSVPWLIICGHFFFSFLKCSVVQVIFCSFLGDSGQLRHPYCGALTLFPLDVIERLRLNTGLLKCLIHATAFLICQHELHLPWRGKEIPTQKSWLLAHRSWSVN